MANTIDYYFLNGKSVQSVPASLAFSNTGFLWSQSAFTTVAIKNGEMLFYKEHMDRLESSNEWLLVKNPPKKEEVLKSIKKAYQEIRNQTQILNWRLRVTVFKDLIGEMNTLFIFSKSLENPPPLENLTTVELPLKRNYKSEGIKLADYGETFRLKEKLQSEILLCDELGFVSEASVGNIIFFNGVEWHTPENEAAIFKGIGLSYGLEGLKLKETKIHRDSLVQYQATMFINSVRGVVPILKIDGLLFNSSLQMGEKIMKIFNENSVKRSCSL